MNSRTNPPDDRTEATTSRFSADGRSEPRRRINKKPEGSFTVESRGTKAEVLEVIDISRAGIRLKINRALDAPAPVLLGYRNATMSMQLNGEICWQSSVDDGSRVNHVVGIELIGPSVLVDQL